MNHITKRSTLTLFMNVNDVKSHMVRVVLFSKGVAYDVEKISEINSYRELIQTNKQANVPTIIDRDLMINDVRIILDYLDDRFPHPPLYPVYPDLKANFRMILKELEKEMFDKIEDLSEQDPKVMQEAAHSLIKFINSCEGLIDPVSYTILNEDFSIIDCYLAPVMYRIIRIDPKLRAEFTVTIQEYQRRIFAKENFIQSLNLQHSRGFMAEKER